MRRSSPLFLPMVAVLLPFAAGCGPDRPGVVEVHGVVLLDKQPLPNAVIEFFPAAEAYETEMRATGTTDEKGRFTLKCHWQDKDGAMVGKNRVVVYEDAPAAPAERPERGASPPPTPPTPRLPNRPIPPKYATASSTPLQIEVKVGQTDYTIELTR